MVQTDELEEATAIATTDTGGGGIALGSRMEKNRIREVYWIKLLNRYAGTNVVSILERASGGPVRVKDKWSLVQGDMVAWPDELKKDSVPLYVVKTDNASVKYVRATCDVGGAFVRVMYRDLP